MNLHCPRGHVVEGLSFNTRNAVCPVHDVPLLTGMQVRQGKGLKRSGGFRSQNESPAERAARQEFHRIVCEWPCWAKRYRGCGGCNGLGVIDAPGSPITDACPDCNGEGQHHCSGPKDAHHLIPASFIRDRLRHLPEDELLAILYNPLLGAPLCRAAHDAVEARTEIIYFEELSEELREWVGGLPDFMLLRLEQESPMRGAVARG